MERRSFGIGVLFLLLAVRVADAQVASLGEGWLLDSAGSITPVSAEVISGRNSVKGSSSNPDPSLAAFFLRTDPTFIHFAPNQGHTITASYRIIRAAAGGFGVEFASGTAYAAGVFGPGTVIRGSDGASGTATFTGALLNYTDYAAVFSVNGDGAIAIDDIRITNSAGQLVASENAEGPTLAPGPLNFQVTDAIALLTPAQAVAVSAAAKDLDGDGYPETILTLATPRPTTTPLEPIVIEASGRMRVATADFFPAGAPTVKDSPMTIFADIDNDGLTDILFADAGSDAEPFPGSRIGVALNLGGGKYRDVSSLIPADQQTTRSYAIAVGDIFGDGRVEIILPDQNRGTNTALLRWNGSGFDEIRNWIPQSIWSGVPALLNAQNWMSLADFDGDGRLDLLVGGQDHNPNFQIVFGGPGGFTAGTLLVLPDGPFGHVSPPAPDGTLTTAEVSPVVVADFNNDGMPDIFAVIRNITLFSNGCPTAFPCRFDVGDSTYQVRLNQGSRNFVDVSPSPYLNLGRVEFQNLMAIDINNDGFLDVVGTYTTDPPPGTSPQWATTLFLNDGTGVFQVVDGAQFLGVTTTPSNGQRWNLGSFVPTVISPGRTEGIVFQTVFGGQPRGLNLFKVVANGSLGTGPNFVDPATLGVPGFNEFYYLRHYPDAAAAVQAGQYSSGLAHYLAVGAAKGYRPHAPRAIASSRAPTAADFDDDARADLAVFRPTNGTWYTRYSAQGYSTADGFQWGQAGDIPISGDFDGDGKTELAVFRPSNGTWYIRYSSLGYSIASAGVFQWGAAGDVPIAADFDGDGRTELTVWRPSNGVWYIRYSSFGFNIGNAGVFQWGVAGDVPIAADVDGDGKTDLTVWRPSNGVWYIRYSSFGFNIGNAGVFQWGVAGDVPIAADVDSDGKTELTVWRPSNGVWYIRYSSLGFNIGNAGVFQWGAAGDVPIAADFDGDGKTELTVWRPSNGVWYIRYSSFGFNIANAGAFQWGLAGDAAVK